MQQNLSPEIVSKGHKYSAKLFLIIFVFLIAGILIGRLSTKLHISSINSNSTKPAEISPVEYIVKSCPKNVKREGFFNRNTQNVVIREEVDCKENYRFETKTFSDFSAYDIRLSYDNRFVIFDFINDDNPLTIKLFDYDRKLPLEIDEEINNLLVTDLNENESIHYAFFWFPHDYRLLIEVTGMYYKNRLLLAEINSDLTKLDLVREITLPPAKDYWFYGFTKDDLNYVFLIRVSTKVKNREGTGAIEELEGYYYALKENKELFTGVYLDPSRLPLQAE